MKYRTSLDIVQDPTTAFHLISSRQTPQCRETPARDVGTQLCPPAPPAPPAIISHAILSTQSLVSLVSVTGQWRGDAPPRILCYPIPLLLFRNPPHIRTPSVPPKASVSSHPSLPHLHQGPRAHSIISALRSLTSSMSCTFQTRPNSLAIPISTPVIAISSIVSRLLDRFVQ